MNAAALSQLTVENFIGYAEIRGPVSPRTVHHCRCASVTGTGGWCRFLIYNPRHPACQLGPHVNDTYNCSPAVMLPQIRYMTQESFLAHALVMNQQQSILESRWVLRERTCCLSEQGVCRLIWIKMTTRATAVVRLAKNMSLQYS
jgi:hypothetical protein